MLDARALKAPAAAMPERRCSAFALLLEVINAMAATKEQHEIAILTAPARS